MLFSKKTKEMSSSFYTLFIRNPVRALTFFFFFHFCFTCKLGILADNRGVGGLSHVTSLGVMEVEWSGEERKIVENIQKNS